MLPAHAAPEQLCECQQRSCIVSSQGYDAEIAGQTLALGEIILPALASVLAELSLPAPRAAGPFPGRCATAQRY